jgi:hypothetical protein
MAVNLELQVFQSTNGGETTELRNFVTDFQAVPPHATNTVVWYGDGGERPRTHSVQSGRLGLAFGAAF